MSRFIPHPSASSLGRAGLVAFAALGLGAGSAQAGTVTLEHTCKYPLVDVKPLTVKVTHDIPATAPVGTKVKANIDVEAIARGGTSEAIDTLDAATIDGKSKAFTSVNFPSGRVQNIVVDLAVNKWTRPAGPLPEEITLTADGTAPEVTLDEVGRTSVKLDRIALNLTAYYADGSKIDVKKLKTDIDGLPVTDSDGDPLTFDVYCKLNTGQSNEIAAVDVTGDVNLPPTKVVGLKAGAVTSSTVALSWTAATDPDGAVAKYNVYRDGVKVGESTTTSFVAPITANTAHAFKVEAVDDDGLIGPVSDALEVKIAGPDTTAPTLPGNVQAVREACSGDVKVQWAASTDAGSGVKGYILKLDDGPNVEVSASATSYTFKDVDQEDGEVSVAAVDNVGNVTLPVAGFYSTPTPPPGKYCGPATPIVSASEVTKDSVLLSWSAAPDAQTVGYNVYRDGVKVNAGLITGTSYRVTGLTPKTGYSFVVEAVGINTEPAKSAAVAVTTGSDVVTTCPQGFACYDYAAKGKTTLKTLTAGNLPLVGGIKAQLKVSDGSFTADLTLANTSGRLVAAGFLPITAKVGFAPFGKTTGVLNDATGTQPQSIETNSKVRIKVLEVKLFGSIPLAGGNNCQTKQLSDINLKSTNAFDPLKGGSIGGTYKISDLNGCGVLNGLVSPLTAGGGNTISLDLVRKP